MIYLVVFVRVTHHYSNSSDVVTAYKGLLKEKEALGATVKALSVKQVSTSQAAPSREKDPTDGGDTDEVRLKH